MTLSNHLPSHSSKSKGLNLQEAGLLQDTGQPSDFQGLHSDTRLNKIVDAWPLLPSTVQSTILALVRATVGK